MAAETRETTRTHNVFPKQLEKQNKAPGAADKKNEETLSFPPPHRRPLLSFPLADSSASFLEK